MYIEYEFDPAQDTVPLIFDQKFLVRVPTLAVTPEWELEEFGVIATPGVDMATHLANDLSTCYLTIADMVEIWRKGFKILLKDPRDAEVIYDNISKHLHAWRIHLETSINTRKPPIEDLMDLDEFATNIFQNNKGRLVQHQDDSAAWKTPLERSGLGRLLNPYKEPTEQQDYSEVERQPIVDDIIGSFGINDIDLSKL